jgi:hypothetical protein
MFTANGAHVRHFSSRQELVTSLHLGTLKHLKVVDWLLHFFSVDSPRSVVQVASFGFSFESRGAREESCFFFASSGVLNTELAEQILVLLSDLFNHVKLEISRSTERGSFRGIIIPWTRLILDCKPFLQLGLGHLVVRLDLVRVLKRVSNHV